jgi:oligosaccharyltransferase complex subunit epsilon
MPKQPLRPPPAGGSDQETLRGISEAFFKEYEKTSPRLKVGRIIASVQPPCSRARCSRRPTPGPAAASLPSTDTRPLGGLLPSDASGAGGARCRVAAVAFLGCDAIAECVRSPLTPSSPQLLYAMLVGSFPFNAFLAGFFCCLGSFVLTVALRLQLTLGLSEGIRKTPERAFAEYSLAMCCLLLASWNLIG